MAPWGGQRRQGKGREIDRQRIGIEIALAVGGPTSGGQPAGRLEVVAAQPAADQECRPHHRRQYERNADGDRAPADWPCASFSSWRAQPVAPEVPISTRTSTSCTVQ